MLFSKTSFSQEARACIAETAGLSEDLNDAVIGVMSTVVLEKIEPGKQYQGVRYQRMLPYVHTVLARIVTRIYFHTVGDASCTIVVVVLGK